MSVEIESGTKLYITRGDTPTFVLDMRLELENKRVVVFTPPAGSHIYFRMKKKIESSNVVLEKEITNGELAFTEADTASLPFGTYLYEIEYVDGSYHETFIRPTADMGVIIIGAEIENHA